MRPCHVAWVVMTSDLTLYGAISFWNACSAADILKTYGILKSVRSIRDIHVCVCMCVFVYVFVYVCVCLCMCVCSFYTYIPYSGKFLNGANFFIFRTHIVRKLERTRIFA